MLALVGVLVAAGMLSGCIGNSVSVGHPISQASFRLSSSGRAATRADLDDAILGGGVLAKLPAGQSASFLGLSVAADRDSIVYLGSSSELIFAACIAGRVSAEPGHAGGGEVMVWPIAGGPAEIVMFDAARFLKSSAIAQDEDARVALEADAANQQRLAYWGLIQSTARNLQSPASLPSAEAVRRSFLSNVAIVASRRASGGDSDALTEAVARRFVAAVAARDRAAVADLLDPDLFSRDGHTADWAVLRLRFAGEIVGGSLPAQLAQATVEPVAAARDTRRVKGASTYIIHFSQHDDVPFVNSLEPEASPSNVPQPAQGGRS